MATDSSSAVLRVSRFRRRALWSEIDVTLRDAMPTYRAQPGLLDAWLGRHGPEVDDERVIVSIWELADAERESLRFPEMLSEIRTDIELPRRVVVPVAFHVGFPRSLPPAILRIYVGKTRPGQLDAYVEETRRGSLVDSASDEGPIVVCMGLDRPDHFMTASIWTDWRSIEASTGSDVRRPLRTRNSEHLVSGGPIHYEIV